MRDDNFLRKELKNILLGDIMETLGDADSEKITQFSFYCEQCNYICFKKFNFEKHLSTAKHIEATNGDTKVGADNESSQDDNMLTKYNCAKCNKKYMSRNGLWKHKKIYHKNEKTNDDISNKELVMLMLKENTEIKNMMMKVIENVTNTTNNNKTTNNNNTTNINYSHNKAFNLNVFLNETCKDAMNISDFVNSIKLSLEDLENTARKGYIEGVSDIIVKNLNNIEDHLRPLHCSDTKREILYVKDNDEWTKETNDKPILTKAIKVIANENIKQIKHWREKYPDCTSATSKKNDLYLKIVSNSMNGLTEEEGKKNINKIISNVAKKTVIQKDYIL
jgi:hypothetical protein